MLHGRSPAKLDAARAEVPGSDGPGDAYIADLSSMAGVAELAASVAANHARLDALVNNAGVFGVKDASTADGLDVRFAVNTIAPFLLTRKLMPLLHGGGRIVNVSSAAQAPVNRALMVGESKAINDFDTYAQSKLALIIWTRHLAASLPDDGTVVVAVNPGSLLATKMVKEAFGTPGGDIGVGADILSRAAVSDEFNAASGRYFDNDARRFGDPHPGALDKVHCEAVMAALDELAARFG